MRQAAVLVALALAACTRASAPPERVAAQRFPLVEGPGEVRVPSGAPMVVNVWATWCEPCRREMQSLAALDAALAPSGVRVVGISVDRDRHLAAEFLRAQRLPFANGIDAREGQGLAVTKFPTTLVIDAEGVVRWRVEAARDWADPAAARRVLAALGMAP